MPMTSDELQAIRDEVLRPLVARVNAAKDEMADVVAGSPARMLAGLTPQFAASNLAAAQIGCAIVCALHERGAIDTARVVERAQWMADNQPAVTAPAITTAVSNTLRTFATVLASMTSARPAGPAARN
jgi:hypothetical protein